MMTTVITSHPPQKADPRLHPRALHTRQALLPIPAQGLCTHSSVSLQGWWALQRPPAPARRPRIFLRGPAHADAAEVEVRAEHERSRSIFLPQEGGEVLHVQEARNAFQRVRAQVLIQAQVQLVPGQPSPQLRSCRLLHPAQAKRQAEAGELCSRPAGPRRSSAASSRPRPCSLLLRQFLRNTMVPRPGRANRESWPESVLTSECAGSAASVARETLSSSERNMSRSGAAPLLGVGEVPGRRTSRPPAQLQPERAHALCVRPRRS